MKDIDTYHWLVDSYQKLTNVKSFIANNLDKNGNLKEEGNRDNNRPDQVEIEDFMRFFKDLHMAIEDGNISWEDAKKKFSYYALKFDEYSFFHEQVRDGYDSDIWSEFRLFCDHVKQIQTT